MVAAIDEDKRLDLVFQALSDSTRRDMLRRLEHGPLSLSKLSEDYEISLPAAMKHLRVLEDAGLASSNKEGRVRTVQPRPAGLMEAKQWVEHYSRFWDNALNQFADFVRSREAPREDT